MKYAKNLPFATNVSISISLVNATQTKSVICGLGTTLPTSLLTLPVKTTHPLTPTTDALGTPANATGWPTASQGPVTTDKMPAAVATVLLLMNGANPTFLRGGHMPLLTQALPAAKKYTTTIFCLKSVASIPMVTTVLLLLVTVSPQAALLLPQMHKSRL